MCVCAVVRCRLVQEHRSPGREDRVPRHATLFCCRVVSSSKQIGVSRSVHIHSTLSLLSTGLRLVSRGQISLERDSIGDCETSLLHAFSPTASGETSSKLFLSSCQSKSGRSAEFQKVLLHVVSNSLHAFWCKLLCDSSFAVVVLVFVRWKILYVVKDDSK